MKLYVLSLHANGAFPASAMIRAKSEFVTFVKKTGPTSSFHYALQDWGAGSI